MIKSLLSAAALAAVTATGAAAATYNFSYAFNSSADIVTGSFEGDLQGDGNTILITGVYNDLALNGVLHTDFIDTFYPAIAPQAFALLDGSAADFVFTPVARNNGFALASGTVEQWLDIGAGTNINGSGIGTLTIAAVPLPASALLLASGLGLLSLQRRKRQAAA